MSEKFSAPAGARFGRPLSALGHRFAAALKSRRTLTTARVVAPLLFGLYSLRLGADSNWDLCNYHLYNAYAWLHDRMQIDLAPAGFHSYFNPLLDVPLYWMNQQLPARWVGFLMGTLHGLTFVLLLSISQRALPALPSEDHRRVPLLLALAGCLTAYFLSGIGNSMGDDTTALLVLSALLVMLSMWERIHVPNRRVAVAVIGSGLLVGMAVGLKLTNVVFAMAMCGALLANPGPARVRIRLELLFGFGILLGFAPTGGYWMVHLWKLFGNPLYPQFSAIFPNPLTRPIGSADWRWPPQRIVETIAWPFIFSANSHRIGELSIRQVIWPIVYLLFWTWVASRLIPKLAHRDSQELDPRARFVVLFVALSYLAWMELFSIARYLVAAEVLTPLVAFVLLRQLLDYPSARRAGTWMIGVATVIVLVGGTRSWGHQGWADPVYHAEVPPMAQPERTTVIIVNQGLAWGWVATQFPPAVAFAQVGGSFPGTALYAEKVRNLVRARGGSAFAITDATPEEGLEATELKSRIAGADRSLAAKAAKVVEPSGFVLDPAACARFRAGIGTGVVFYQWCPLDLNWVGGIVSY